MNKSTETEASEDRPALGTGEPVAQEASEPLRTRSRAGTKKVVLLGVWIALLVGLVVGINFMGSQTGEVHPGPPKPPAPAMPKLDPAKLEAAWPQIIAHAAASPRGAAGARYTLAEFGDFQCPQCGKARPILEKLMASSPAQVNLIFLHRPLPTIHEWALPSGQASEIAAASGKFWPMYDVLYAHQDDLEPGFYGKYAAEAGLDKAAFTQAFDAGQRMNDLKAASAFADSLGIGVTPTVLVRDNVAQTVAVYVGLDSGADSEAGIPENGLDKLIAQPPWVKP